MINDTLYTYYETYSCVDEMYWCRFLCISCNNIIIIIIIITVIVIIGIIVIAIIIGIIMFKC